jgi:hypothetical protein
VYKVTTQDTGTIHKLLGIGKEPRGILHTFETVTIVCHKKSVSEKSYLREVRLTCSRDTGGSNPGRILLNSSMKMAGYFFKMGRDCFLLNSFLLHIHNHPPSILMTYLLLIHVTVSILHPSWSSKWTFFNTKFDVIEYPKVLNLLFHPSKVYYVPE